MSLFLPSQDDSSVAGIANGVEELLPSISSHLWRGDKVQLSGFSTFEVRKCSAHMGVGPRTTGKIEIPAGKYPAFKVGKGFKDEILSDLADEVTGASTGRK